jgi:hypothetical protein
MAFRCRLAAVHHVDAGIMDDRIHSPRVDLICDATAALRRPPTTIHAERETIWAMVAAPERACSTTWWP